MVLVVQDDKCVGTTYHPCRQGDIFDITHMIEVSRFFYISDQKLTWKNMEEATLTFVS